MKTMYRIGYWIGWKIGYWLPEIVLGAAFFCIIYFNVRA